jgi:hypothetical protein
MEDAGTINPQVIFSKLDFKLFNVKRFLKKLLRLQALSEGDDKSKALAFEEYFFENFNERQGGGILSVSAMLQQMISHHRTYFDDYPLGVYLKKIMAGKSFM